MQQEVEPKFVFAAFRFLVYHGVPDEEKEQQKATAARPTQ